MEFDKNKVLTVVTADQAKIGQKGWFANILTQLEEKVNKEPFDFIENVKLSGDTRFPFSSEHVRYNWALFYPAPEPTYPERQAEWVKANNVKGGTKVRVTRTFTENEDGSCCWEHDDLVGMTGTVDEYGITSHNFGVNMSDGKLRAIPYFALEVVKEPTYEERQAQWVRENNVKVGTKVRFTKGFDADSDGSSCWVHRDAKGKEGVVNEIFDTYLSVVVYGDYWVCPFTALEVIKEPIYRPFSNAREFKPHRDEWVVQNTVVRRIISYSCCGVTISQPYGEGYGRFISFETAFKELKFESGEPFGVKYEQDTRD